MKKKIYTSLGIMTGTSMDGVDISLIKSDGDEEYAHILDDYFEFDNDLHKKLVNLRKKLSIYEDLKTNENELNEIEREFTLFIGKIVNQVIANYSKEINFLGFHGQTIFHDSDEKVSKQLGDGKLLSQITKKIVISNFRDQDLNNGGQGAPLTPIFHNLLSKIIYKKYNIEKPINVINIGGITNITQILNSDESQNKNLYAFDVGPGNCLIDEWIRRNSKKNFDENGKISKSGKVNDLVLNQALDNFDKNKFDKSLDIKDFDISFAKGLTLEDGCATLTNFSAILIANGINHINNLNNSLPNENLVCGGGRKNLSLIKYINDHLDQKNNIKMIDDFELDGDFIESQAFGYLAIRSYLRLPISFPNTTGCISPTTGGVVVKNF